MEEPGRLQSIGSQRVGHNWATSLSLFTFLHWRRKWQPTPVFLPGESQGWGSLMGCRLWGHTVSDTTEVTWQQQQQSHNKPLVESLFLTRNQAQSFWSRSTDSKTLDNQRTNLREYQIVRTHTKKTTWIQDPALPTTSSTLCRMPLLNNKQNKNTNPIISRQDYHLT